MPRQTGGICGLCLKEKHLESSHVFPAGLYKLCRPPDGKSPILTSGPFQGHTDLQFQDQFLCSDCESRFDRLGENWVLAHCYRGEDKFLLREKLRAARPFLHVDGTSIYAGSEIASVNVNALVYFSASIFWRLAARRWHIRGAKLTQVKFGPYEEEFRQFLLGEAAYPENAALTVLVSRQAAPLITFGLSPMTRVEHAHTFRLHIPGILFWLTLGKAMQPVMKRGCIVKGGSNPIWLGSEADEHINVVVKQVFRIHAERRALIR